MSSTHRHLLLDFFWQVISGPPCISPEIFSCSPTLVFIAQNYPRAGALATNTRMSGLLEKISGNISVPWYIIYENLFFVLYLFMENLLFLLTLY
jgi:hypothetical protein